MSYAVRKDGQGWRAVNGPDDVEDDENFSEQEPGPLTPTKEQVVAQYEEALDAHLDAVAKADRWRDRFTFAIRAGYENPWQAKAKAFGTWMDDCNARAYALLAAVTAGTTELPTVEEFIAAMPPAPVLP